MTFEITANDIKGIISSMNRDVNNVENNGEREMSVTFDDLNLDFSKIANDCNTDDIQKVEEKCEEIFQEVLELFPGKNADLYRNLIHGSIGQKLYERKDPLTYAKESGAPENTLVVLAVSRVHDANGINKKMAWKKHKDNPENAETDMYVAVVRQVVDSVGKLGAVKDAYVYVKTGNKYSLYRNNGVEWLDTKYTVDNVDGITPETPRVIPVDNKEFYGQDQPNDNYGKPLPYKPEREFIGVDPESGDIVMGHGDIGIDKTRNGKVTPAYAHLLLGYDTSVWGANTSVDGKPYASKIKAKKDAVENRDPFKSKTIEGVGEVTLWKMAEMLADTEWYYAIDEVSDLPGWGYFVVSGTIGRVNISEGNKNAFITVRNDENVRGIALNTYYAPVIEACVDLVEGDEVIVIGERYSQKNKESGEWEVKNALVGVVANPSNDFSKQLAMLKNKMKE